MDSTPAVSRSPKTDILYDAGRDVYYQKPVLRGWLHALWFVASLVLGALRLARVQEATRTTAMAIYASPM